MSLWCRALYTSLIFLATVCQRVSFAGSSFWTCRCFHGPRLTRDVILLCVCVCVCVFCLCLALESSPPPLAAASCMDTDEVGCYGSWCCSIHPT